ncbi:hypothetical protein [Streptacidiphilus fuscans]|uniref:Uncharacterized protein n=1 Tax=Streptacidiphilus fuscans TaxID=2789292 RepID=A0A931B904_9ACTN|nr:hypothetical protein [Streptacidiphilus fuscans]MBF9069090.1 hypothetical protein [Streptacidiphilus fuscans]
MTEWATLSDACGPAEHVPVLLERFAGDPSGVLSELMDHLCPQLDTAFSASFAALPRLAEIAASCRPDDLPSVLEAAGAIASCAPGLSEVGGPLDVFSAPLAVLHQLTDECLSRTTAVDDYVVLLQSLLSFEGVEVWDRCLEGLATGEYEVDCPYCGVNLCVVIEADDCFCCSDDYASGDVLRSPLRPAAEGDLEDLPRRLHDRATADGQTDLARGVPYLFGRATCTDCSTEFTVADRVKARWIP